MSATPPTERAHQVAFFEAECPGACVSRLLERFRRVVPLYGGNLGYVDRIGIRHEGTVYWHGTVMAMGDGNEEPEPWETLHESVVTRLEGRAFLVFGGRR